MSVVSLNRDLLAEFCYAPFLFWVVVSIGSRRYTRQPTLTRALALPVTQLALQSIIARTKPIERMKGLILLLNWPFPSGPFYRDPSFVLGGTLLHMAMHCGQIYHPKFNPTATIANRMEVGWTFEQLVRQMQGIPGRRRGFVRLFEPIFERECVNWRDPS
ncbi:hypothetical protein V1506DRAFT_542244 [Lipomyces tetrasporus]